MVSSVGRILERYQHLVGLRNRLVQEDVETTILEALDRVELNGLAINFHTGAIQRIHQTGQTTGLHQVSHISVITKVNTNHVAVELNSRTILINLELDVVEIELVVGIAREVESSRTELHAGITLHTDGLSNLAFLGEGLPLRRKGNVAPQVIIDVLARLHMRLRGHILSNVSSVVERDAILRTNGHVLVEAEPELSVVVVGNLSG